MFLTWVFVSVAILVTVIKIVKPSSVEWYRMLWVYVLAASWLINFYSVKKKQTERKNG